MSVTQILLKASFLLHAGTKVIGCSIAYEEYGAMNIPTGNWIVKTEMSGVALPDKNFKDAGEAIAYAMSRVGWSAQNVAQAELDAEDRGARCQISGSE